jgi:hypothetical protein
MGYPPNKSKKDYPPTSKITEAFDSARNEISDEGVFSEDQCCRLRQMLNLIEIALADNNG